MLGTSARELPYIPAKWAGERGHLGQSETNAVRAHNQECKRTVASSAYGDCPQHRLERLDPAQNPNRAHLLKMGVYDLGRGGDRDQSAEVPWEGGGGAGGEKGRMDLGEQISSKESICTRIAPAGSN